MTNKTTARSINFAASAQGVGPMMISTMMMNMMMRLMRKGGACL